MILTHFVSRINFTDEHHCSNLWLTRSKKKKSTWSNKKENFDFVHSAFPFCSTSEYHSSSESSYTDVRLRLTHLSLGLSTTPIWTQTRVMQLTVAPDGSALLHIYCMSLTAHVKPAHIHWLLNELLRKVRSHFMRWPLAFWFLLREFPGVSAVCCNCTCYNIRHCALVLMVVWCKSWASLKVFEYFSTTGQFLRQQSSCLATSWPKMCSHQLFQVCLVILLH